MFLNVIDVHRFASTAATVSTAGTSLNSVPLSVRRFLDCLSPFTSFLSAPSLLEMMPELVDGAQPLTHYRILTEQAEHSAVGCIRSS
jgi:hypothetical protein